jgi:hypothetical protein
MQFMKNAVLLLLRLFRRAVAVLTIVAVTGIPLLYAFHNHNDALGHFHHTRACKDHKEHGAHGEPGCNDDAHQCGICEYYAHYIPRAVLPIAPFLFLDLPVFLRESQALPSRIQPCLGLLKQQTNKGPPINYPTV